MDDTITLIEVREQDGAEVNRPDPIVNVFASDEVVVERIDEIHQPGLNANRAGIGHPLDEKWLGYSSGCSVDG